MKIIRAAVLILAYGTIAFFVTAPFFCTMENLTISCPVLESK